MKKIVMVVGTASVLLFSGCAKNDLSMNNTFTSEVKEFKNGVVIDTKKVLINDRKISTLTGVGVGAVGGGVINSKDRTKGAVVGAVVGGIVGAVIGNEVEAYKTTIKVVNDEYVTYLSSYLPNLTKVEFILRDSDEISNVNVLSR